ncbi:MAG: methyltransferase domain-containing protein [Desulfovibrionaceae bacterium]
MRETIKSLCRSIFGLYPVVYRALCGRHPDLYPWHFLWLALRDLNRDLRAVLPTLQGRVLDLGCGHQPYRGLFTRADAYTGCDVTEQPGVDVVITPDGPLPFPDGSFDAALSTQVFEHVADLDHTVGELRRILAPGGRLVVSVPFIFQVHGAPHDYRRLTEYGAVQALPGFEVEEVRRQGAIGSSLAVLLLSWMDTQLGANVYSWTVKCLLLPVWIPFCLLVNLAGLGLDLLDSTRCSYHNLLLVARKTEPSPDDAQRLQPQGNTHAPDL